MTQPTQELGPASPGVGQDARASESDREVPAKPKRPAIDRSDAASCICGDRWTGTSKCHCSGCHRLFSTVTMFDRHRVNAKCADPATDMITPRDGSPPRPAYVFKQGTWCSADEFKRAGQLFGGAE